VQRARHVKPCAGRGQRTNRGAGEGAAQRLEARVNGAARN